MIRYGGCVSGQEEIDAVTEVLKSGDWACGEKTAEFEAKAANQQERRHALFVNSGSSALLLAAAGVLPEGSRVALPALQFPTLYSAVIRMGCEPVLVDIDDTLNMDPQRLEDVIDEVDAVGFVHIAGNPSNVSEVSMICGEEIPLIEDICEAFGAEVNGVLAGNFGKVSATSTHGAHHISTGEGGLVFTHDNAVHAKMKRLRDWGRAQGAADIPGYYPGYVFSEFGFNLHATDIQAALGVVQLDRFENFVEQRVENWGKLRKLTAHLPIEVPTVNAGCRPSWYTFPMLVPDRRDELIRFLWDAGIESRPVVAGNMARQPMSLGDPGLYPVADKWFHRGLWVSVHPKLGNADVARIAGALHKFWN